MLEFWSAFGDNVDQELAAEFEVRTGNQLMIRKFSIDEMKAELLLASRSKNYMPDVAWVPSDFLGLHKFIGISPIPKVWIKVSPPFRLSVSVCISIFDANGFCTNNAT